MDEIAAFLIEKETITGKEFMEILHRIEGDQVSAAHQEGRIVERPYEAETKAAQPETQSKAEQPEAQSKAAQPEAQSKAAQPEAEKEAAQPEEDAEAE